MYISEAIRYLETQLKKQGDVKLMVGGKNGKVVNIHTITPAFTRKKRDQEHCTSLYKADGTNAKTIQDKIIVIN